MCNEIDTMMDMQSGCQALLHLKKKVVEVENLKVFMGVSFLPFYLRDLY